MPTKKTVTREADLDPRGTRHTRPGSKIAEAAIALSKPSRAKKRSTADSAPTRPGFTAAARAVAATKPKRRRAR